MYTKFYKLWFDDSDPDAFVANEYNLQGVDDYFADESDRQLYWPEELPTFMGTGANIEDYLGTCLMGWVLFSNRVCACFNILNITGVDFHPVRVIRYEEGKAEEEIPGYSVLHVWQEIEALDKQRARWDEDPNKPGIVMGIPVPVLRAEVLIGVDAFRLKECNNGVVFFSERLKNAIEETGATGFRFSLVKAF